MHIERTSYRIYPAIAAFIIVTCAMCTSGAFAPSIILDAVEGQLTDNSLINTGWQLVSYDNGKTLVPVASGSKITLKFDKDGSLGGSGGINLYFGSYTIDNNAITIGPIGCTEMAGPERLMDQESMYFSLLNSVSSVRTVGSTLELSDATGRVVLKFRAADAGNGAVGENPATVLPGSEWQLSSYSDGNAVVSGTDINTITLVFTDTGNINGFSGVNTYFGSYNLDGNSISIGPLASTKMAGPEPLMTLENVYLNRLGSVTGVDLSADSLSLTDKDGNAVLVFGQKNAGSHGRYNAFLPHSRSHTVVQPGTGEHSSSSFIDRFQGARNWSGSTGRFLSILIKPGKGPVTTPATVTHPRPATMPRYNDSIIGPVTYPGGPLY